MGVFPVLWTLHSMAQKLMSFLLLCTGLLRSIERYKTLIKQVSLTRKHLFFTYEIIKGFFRIQEAQFTSISKLVRLLLWILRRHRSVRSCSHFLRRCFEGLPPEWFALAEKNQLIGIWVSGMALKALKVQWMSFLPDSPSGVNHFQ